MSAALWLTAVIALLDGAFSGYRAAQGRTGRLPSWRRDAVAHLRGVVVWVLLVAAPIAVGIALVPVGTRLEAARALLPLLVAAATHDPAAALLTAFLAACQLAVEPVAGRRISC